MSMFRPPSVDEQPIVVLSSWSVFELPDGDRHFVGFHAAVSTGRVSSKIVDWDDQEKVGTTRSGRRYQLMGETGYDSDANYVWGAWLAGYKIDPLSTTNVSSQYDGAPWPELRKLTDEEREHYLNDDF